MGPITLCAVDEDVIIPVIAIGGGLIFGVITVIANTVRTVMVSRHREESRREIAAYVAEGSMTPNDAAMLLAAGQQPPGSRQA